MNPDGFDVVIGLVAPDLLQDQGWCNGLTMTLQQAVEQLKFEVGQANRAVEPNGLEAFGHQGQRAVAENLVVVAGSDRCTVAPPQQGFDAGLKFLEIEGFGQVVVGAGVEATDLVLRSAKGRQHQNRNSCGAVIAPQALTQGQTVDLREHQVEQDQIRCVLQGKGLTLDAVFSTLNVEAAVLEMATDQVAHVAVVFDQQDAGLHRFGGGTA